MDSLLGVCLQGGFEREGQAGRAHDVMALKCRGEDGPLNRPAAEYAPLRPLMDGLSVVRSILSSVRFPAGALRGGLCTENCCLSWLQEEVVFLLRQESKGGGGTRPAPAPKPKPRRIVKVRLMGCSSSQHLTE